VSSFVVSIVVVVAVIAGCTWLAPVPGGTGGHQRATRRHERVIAGGSLMGLVLLVGVLVAVAVGVSLVAIDALLRRAAGT
jgi:uncharacterized membrane protein